MSSELNVHTSVTSLWKVGLSTEDHSLLPTTETHVKLTHDLVLINSTVREYLHLLADARLTVKEENLIIVV